MERVITERAKNLIIKQLKLWAPVFEKYKQEKNYSSFDLGYTYEDKLWEVTFYSEVTETVYSYLGKSPKDIMFDLHSEKLL